MECNNEISIICSTLEKPKKPNESNESNSNKDFLNKCCLIGPIRERFEELYYDIKLQKIINFEDVKKGELYINLIHYDIDLKNKQNIKYYRYFSVDTVGGYYPFDEFDMLKTFISKLNELSFKCSYILMISGNEIEKILEEFHKYDFLIEFIIFKKKDDYDYLNNKYNKIKIITNEFSKIRKYLQSKKFSKEDLNMDNHLPMTPLITYYDYKKAIFPIHRILAYFFKHTRKHYYFSKEYFLKAKEFINKSVFDIEIKEKIIKIMEDLINHSGYIDFPKACIKYYTGENLCYVFNKALRNFEKFYVEMCYFIGLFYNALFNYALDNKEKALNKKTILYRDLIMDKLDLYSYKFSENDIICFTSFTSTTLNEKLNFEQSNNAKKINKIEELEEKNYVKMIISYNPGDNCVPQGLDVSEESKFLNEKEVLLFPFTFLKIERVEMHSGTQNDKHYIYLTIINRGDILEYGLKSNYSFKLEENGTKLVVDKDNDLKCDNNELYYKMYLKEIEEIKKGDRDEEPKEDSNKQKLENKEKKEVKHKNENQHEEEKVKEDGKKIDEKEKTEEDKEEKEKDRIKKDKQNKLNQVSRLPKAEGNKDNNVLCCCILL